MEVGNCYTWFKEDGKNETRAMLYKLENYGIVKLTGEKKGEDYIYNWTLTDKGKNIINLNEDLKKIGEEGEYLELYKKLLELCEH